MKSRKNEGWDMWHIWGRKEMHTGFWQGNQVTNQGYRMPSFTIPSPDVPFPTPVNSKKQKFNHFSLVQGNNHNTTAVTMVMTTTTNTITTTTPTTRFNIVEDKLPQFKICI